MLRRKPLRRKPFQRKAEAPSVEREPKPWAPSVLAISRGTYAGGTGAGVAKEKPLVCEEYRAIVRQMPCAHCRINGYTQFCHSDAGKGMGLKTDDRRGWPGCGPHDNKPGCHHLIGSTGTFTKQQRRDLEDEYARRTRAEIVRRGLWPKGLPMWTEIGETA